MNRFDDEIDLKALSMGDVKAFDKLFILFYPKVKSFLLSILNDEDESEDLSQDTFIRLWQNKQLLCDVNNLNAYIYQIVKHILYSHIEKCKDVFMTEIEGATGIPSTDEVESLVYSHELEELLNKVIEKMPPQRKQIFCMSRKQGLSIEEISLCLGISKRTVETHISLALSALRKVITALLVFLYS